MKDNYEILLIGKTGDGKSSLGNYLLSQEKFKAFNTTISGTTKTMAKTVGNLTIIDTPGLLDSENNAGEKDKDAKHYMEMVDEIKKRENLKGIIIVKDSNNIRFSTDIQEMIKTICNTFDDPKIFKNIAFVFTKFYMPKKQKKIYKEEASKFVEKAREIIIKFYENKPIDNSNSFQSFFIDSDLDNLSDENSESNKERFKILGWATELAKINTKKIPSKDPRYKEIYDVPETNIKVSEDDNYIYRTTIFYTTKKAKDVNNKEHILEDKKETGRSTNNIPKKKSLWKKISGGIMMGLGILCAPFTFGGSLGIATGGAVLIADGQLDDLHNKKLREI